MYGVWAWAPAAREVGVIGVWVARIAGGMEGACKDEERRTGRGGAAVDLLIGRRCYEGHQLGGFDGARSASGPLGAC